MTTTQQTKLPPMGYYEINQWVAQQIRSMK